MEADIAEALYTILTAAGAVATITEGRIYPGLLPQAEVQYPSMVYRVEQTDDEQTFTSGGNRPDRTRVRFVLVGGKRGSAGYFAARRLATALKTQINGLQAQAIGDVTIQDISRVSQYDSFDEQSQVHCVTADYSIFASYA